jgi:uncharacterized protein
MVKNLSFHVMVKPRGAVCNLDCQYCFYLRKEQLYAGSSLRMSDEVLEAYTRQMIEEQQSPEVTFAWQGGEPTLMGLEFFKKAVALQEKYRKPGMRILNAFQTNATLLDEDWCRFFYDQHFLVGVSLDGPQELHDAYRLDKGGGPTFQKVMTGLELLKKQRVDFNILACVNDHTAEKPLEVYRFFRDQVGARFIQFIPVVERVEMEIGADKPSTTRISQRSVSGPAYGKFLIEIFEEWVRRDVGKVYVQLFDTALGAWLGDGSPGLCIFQKTCGLALAMEHNGDVYACDHFVDQPYLLGNLMQTPLVAMVSGAKQIEFGKDKSKSLPGYCRDCAVRFACNGGCPKDRLLLTPRGEPGLNSLCQGYKAFFRHVDRPMRKMAELLKARRPPAEIMQLYPTVEAHRRHPPKKG